MFTLEYPRPAPYTLKKKSMNRYDEPSNMFLLPVWYSHNVTIPVMNLSPYRVEHFDTVTRKINFPTHFFYQPYSKIRISEQMWIWIKDEIKENTFYFYNLTVHLKKRQIYFLLLKTIKTGMGLTLPNICPWPSICSCLPIIHTSSFRSWFNFHKTHGSIL